MAYTKTNWQDLPDTTTPINATNLNHMETGIKDNDDKLLGNAKAGDFKPASVSWEESGYGDAFKIVPDFNGTDDSNKLYVKGSVGGAGASYSYSNIASITAKNGNVWKKGIDQAEKGYISAAAGNVGTPVGNSCLVIKRANNTEAPNNGVVLEYGTNTNWTGQLYIGDNATQGVYVNGWSNGVRGTWKKLVFLEDVVESSGNANGYYTKYGDGTLICRGFAGPVTTNAGTGSSKAVTFPYNFVDTNWSGTLTKTAGGANWAMVGEVLGNKSKTGFTISTWNNATSQAPDVYYDWIVIGRWK